MIDYLINIDITLFYLINTSLENPITNFIMPIITNSDNWLIIYLIIIFKLIHYFDKTTKKRYLKGFLFATTMLIGVGLTDFITAGILKEQVSRLRPCHSLENINLIINCGSGKSFPSAHASNNFFLATFLSKYFSKYKLSFFIIAFLVAISRVFVGVHFPLDIIFGGILGFLMAYMIIKINNFLFNFN